MSLSPEREGRLTASNFASAMGIGFDSRQKLWRTLTGREPRFQGNEMTEYGNLHEMDAINGYEIETGNIVTDCGDSQVFAIHPDIDWLGCTVDGYADDIVIEAKCPFKQELYPNVPGYYMAQIQGQMMITDKPKCHFICWTPDEIAVWEVMSREDYQTEMLELLTEFYDYWKQDIEPKRKKKSLMPAVSTERII